MSKPRDFWIDDMSTGNWLSGIIDNKPHETLIHRYIHVVEATALTGLQADYDRLKLMLNTQTHLRWELEAEVARLREALDFYICHADCRSDVGFGVCRCSFCKNEPKYRELIKPKAGVE